MYSLVTIQSLKQIPVIGNVHMNLPKFTCLISRLNYMLQVSAEERLKLLREPPQTPSVDNVWKWADAFVNRDYLTSILTFIDPYPPKIQPSPPTFSNFSSSQ